MKLITFLALFAAVLLISAVNTQSSDSEEVVEDDGDVDSGEIDKREALNFFKRTFFHPGKTKNEEIKRETKEVYEEKCENIVPLAKRHCPDIKTWAAFKAYENGE